MHSKPTSWLEKRLIFIQVQLLHNETLWLSFQANKVLFDYYSQPLTYHSALVSRTEKTLIVAQQADSQSGFVQLCKGCRGCPVALRVFRSLCQLLRQTLARTLSNGAKRSNRTCASAAAQLADGASRLCTLLLTWSPLTAMGYMTNLPPRSSLGAQKGMLSGSCSAPKLWPSSWVVTKSAS